MDRWSRIIVDSRHRTADSLSNSLFSVDLPWPVNVPAGTRAHIDAVQFSHVWGTVQEGVNDRLYLTEKLESTVGSTLRQISLTPGTYNAEQLRAHLETKLQSGTTLPGAWAVTLDDGRLSIANATPAVTGWALLYSLSPGDMAALQAILPVFPGRMANELIGYTEPSALGDGTGRIRQGQSLEMSFVDLAVTKQVFIHTNIGETTCMSTSGATDIARRVLVGDAAQGQVITDHLQNSFPNLYFPRETTLQRLSFSIRDHLGALLGLSEHQISFEIVLTRPDE